MRLLSFWLSRQDMLVRWRSLLSDSFKIMARVTVVYLQFLYCGLLSPYFFARCIKSLLQTVHNTRVGCNICGTIYNILAYADDMVLIEPSWAALKLLIDTLFQAATDINIIFNCLKARCMIFNPRVTSKIVSHPFPPFTLYGNLLQCVISLSTLDTFYN